MRAGCGMSELSERLVRAADAAQGVALDPCGESGTRAAVVAVLRELRGTPNSGRREHGRYWSPEMLADLANEIEANPSGENGRR